MDKLVVYGNSKDIIKLLDILMKSFHRDYNDLINKVEIHNTDVEGEDEQ